MNTKKKINDHWIDIEYDTPVYDVIDLVNIVLKDHGLEFVINVDEEHRDYYHYDLKGTGTNEEEKNCDDCDNNGWINSCDEDGNDEIQRCDTCKTFKDDEEAREFVKVNLNEYWKIKSNA